MLLVLQTCVFRFPSILLGSGQSCEDRDWLNVIYIRFIHKSGISEMSEFIQVLSGNRHHVSNVCDPSGATWNKLWPLQHVRGVIKGAIQSAISGLQPSVVEAKTSSLQWWQQSGICTDERDTESQVHSGTKAPFCSPITCVKNRQHILHLSTFS